MKKEDIDVAYWMRENKVTGENMFKLCLCAALHESCVEDLCGDDDEEALLRHVAALRAGEVLFSRSIPMRANGWKMRIYVSAVCEE